MVSPGTIEAVRASLKPGRKRSEEAGMPGFTAFFVASTAAWIVYGMLPSPGSKVLPTLLAALFWWLTFYFVRRWIDEVRPDV